MRPTQLGHLKWMNSWASNICQDEFREGSRGCKRRRQRRGFRKKMRKIEEVNLGFRNESRGIREWNRWNNKKQINAREKTSRNFRVQETKTRCKNTYCRSEDFFFSFYFMLEYSWLKTCQHVDQRRRQLPASLCSPCTCRCVDPPSCRVRPSALQVQ